MTDAPVIHIGENSPEHVAYKLYHDILGDERNVPRTRASRLDLYAECLQAARGLRIKIE